MTVHVSTGVFVRTDSTLYEVSSLSCRFEWPSPYLRMHGRKEVSNQSCHANQRHSGKVCMFLSREEEQDADGWQETS